MWGKKQASGAERRGINGAIDAFNGWFDVFVIAAAKPLAMLGFAMGTVDIFTRGGLATMYWFALAWSIVQAVTIDGLFFAVWYRVFDLKWERGNWRQICALLFIGGVLAVVAFTTNAILGYQQLWGLSDSQQAMLRLGIDPQQFTLLRAVLVVAVAVMIAYVYRTAGNQRGEPVQNGKVLITQASEQREHPAEQGERPMSADNRSQAAGIALNEQGDERSERPGERVSEPVSRNEQSEHTQQYSVSRDEQENEQSDRSQATGVPLTEQPNEQNERSSEHPSDQYEQVSERSEHTHPLGVSGSEQTLGWIEQKMYDALLTNPDEASVLLGLAQVQALPTFTQTLRDRYPGYASYITEGRVANVLRYAREREQVASLTTTDDLEGYRPSVPVSREVFLAELADNPALSLSDYARKTGTKYSTLTRWRRESAKTADAD